MSKSTDLTAKIRFIFEVDAAPGVAQLAQAADGVKVLKFNIGEITQVTTNIKEATSGYGTSIRGLLLNLRMFSFAVRTLRREFGNTNPVIEQISTNLITLAALTTGLAAGYDLLKRGVDAFWAASTGLLGTVKVAIGVMGGLGTVLTGIGVVIAGIAIARWFSDWVTGISAIRRESKGLEVDLSMLKAELEDLNMEQERFSLGLSATSIQIMKLKRAIDLQQAGTEALEAELAAVNAEQTNMRIINAELALEAQQKNLIDKETTQILADNLRMIKAIQIAGRIPISREVAFRALQMTGWVPGQRRPPMRVFQAAAEQTRAGVTPRGGGGANVTINFPNALFQTVEGVREAIIEGARQAADIIRFNQYAEPGTQR